MKSKSFAMMLALGVLGLAACQNTVNTVENTEKQGTPNIVRDTRFVTDGFLKDRLQLRGVRTAETSMGIMTVEVSATNVRTGVLSQAWSGITGENPYPVDYKFTWQDQNGMTVETPLSAWRTIQVKPGETVFFKATAPNARCKDFILNVKESN